MKTMFRSVLSEKFMIFLENLTNFRGSQSKIPDSKNQSNNFFVTWAAVNDVAEQEYVNKLD